MKILKRFFFYGIFFLISLPSKAQVSNCTNLGFELGNFTNWIGYTWRYSTEVPTINTSKVKGIVNRRQTIISDTSAYDANTDYKLKKVPSGYVYSARLGDAIIDGSDSNPRGWEQSLQFTMTIDSSNALLIMKFACVLQYASDHTALMEPRFRFTIYDSSGNKIQDCSDYDVYSSNSMVSGWNTYTPSGSSNSGPGGGGGPSNAPVKWRNWTTVGADLSKYIGQTITLEFMSADCTGRYHYGYAYFVAGCQPLIITVNYCACDSTASLKAPDGFSTYSWTDSSKTVVGTQQTLKVTKPVEGETYTCTMTSATGCTISLTSTIAKYAPKAAFTSEMEDCVHNKVKFNNLSTSTHGNLKYKWDFEEDTTTTTDKSPIHQFKTSGLHHIKLIITNPPSSCTDTIDTVVESFSPPLVGIMGDSTYCPNLGTYLKGYGASYYIWNTGVKMDSIQVTAPGGKYWMIGHSIEHNCNSDTIRRTVIEEPDWPFKANSDTILCAGHKTVLSASGSAIHYLWNTNDTLDSITVSNPGAYTVTGSNKRGCKKAKTYVVVEHPIPNVDFSLSPSSLDKRHNQLVCSIPAQDSVQYHWNLGDNTIGTTPVVQHDYYISNSELAYTISLTATSAYNCTDSASKTIDVVPFVPNVFTPNNDGVNDLFMLGLDLQVFDRNGILLYKGTEGWDGKYKGKFLDPDTYFYVIHYSDRAKHEQTRKGYITLVR